MSVDADRITVIAPARFVTIGLASYVTGYSAKAIERKIEGGTWIEGSEYARAPDGRVLVDLDGFVRWARGERR